MKATHLGFGILVLVIFLLTGQYMDHYHNHLDGMPDGPRLLYRTRHIFILLSGLLNVGLGLYLQTRPSLWRKICQTFGSALVMLAPVLFAVGFFYEPHLKDLDTPFSHWGTYVVATGVFLHLVAVTDRLAKD